jgi:hypothetical protein
MSSEKTNPFGGTDAGQLGGKGGYSGGSSSGGSSRNLSAWNEGVVDYIVGVLQEKGGRWAWPLRDAHPDAVDMPEEWRDHFDIPDDVEKQTVESLCPLTVDTEYVGGAVKVPYSLLKADIDAGRLTEEELFDQLNDVKDRNSDVDDIPPFEPGNKFSFAPEDSDTTLQGDIGTTLNGYHADKITEAFGDDVYVTIGLLPNGDADSGLERFQYLRFYVSDSEKAARKRRRAEVEVGELTQSEYEQWCEANGFEP